MTFIALSQRLTAGKVPLILTGPMLRHVAHDQVTVFVVLREARTVTLRVFEGDVGARTTLMGGSRGTVPLGAKLHVVAVTATPGQPTVRLTPGTTYYYDLDLGGGQTLGSAGVLELEPSPHPLAYTQADLPTFALPPTSLDQVRLVHASCRKPHGESVDALCALDDMIATSGEDARSPAFALARPHQLFLTGDQIYADDVSDHLLFILVDAAQALLDDWEETLPGSTTDNLAPGARLPLTLDAGLTSGFPKGTYAKSHLMRFVEYATMYLFAWSPALWPPDLPTAADIRSRTDGKVLAKELERIQSFKATLPAVRRALANVPTYMVFDDHDVTDDWYMNRRWVGEPRPGITPRGGLLKTPLGRRIVQNALLAYALFQAWGSTPAQFATTGTADEPGPALLAAAGNWRGADDTHDKTIAVCVGMPTSRVLPDAVLDGYLRPDETTLSKPAGALRWHYRVAPHGGRYEVLALDCRTARFYPNRGGDTAAPGLLTEAAIREQVTNQPQDDDRQLTFVIAQTPVLGIPFIEGRQRGYTGNAIWENDVEAWSLHEDAYQRLLAALVIRNCRTVILSGDVHYAFAARMTYWATQPYGQAVQDTPLAAAVAQLTSSALKNQTSEQLITSTLQLHNWGFNQPFINLGELVDRVGWRQRQIANIQLGGRDINPRRWPPRWNSIPAVISPDELPKGSHVAVQPEWRYRVEYVRGSKPAKPGGTLPTLTVLPPGSYGAVRAIAPLHVVIKALITDASGRDIVGRNNLGEVGIELDADVPARVVQRSWWRSRDDESPSPITTFVVPLDPSNPPSPGPLP